MTTTATDVNAALRAFEDARKRALEFKDRYNNEWSGSSAPSAGAVQNSPSINVQTAWQTSQPASAVSPECTASSLSKMPSMTFSLPANNASGPPASTLLNGAS